MNLSEQIVAPVGRLEVVPVVIKFVIIGSQMAVHGQSSELRDPVTMDTCSAGLASTQCSGPSQNMGVQVLNTAVWGLEGVQVTDEGHRTTVAWGLAVPVAAEGAEGVKMACLQVSWGKMRSMDSADSTGGRQGLLMGVDSVVGDVEVV
jgi:hypothetical protein